MINKTKNTRFSLEKDYVHLTVSRAADVGVHMHEFFELVYIAEGYAEHTVDGKKSLVRKGDCFVIDIGSAHSFAPAGAESFAVVNCLFVPEFIDRVLDSNTTFREIARHYLIGCDYRDLLEIPTGRIYHDTDGAIFAHVDTMRREFSQRAAGYMQIVRSSLICVIVLMFRSLTVGTGGRGAGIGAAVSDYIDRNYDRPLSLTEICAEMGYSLPYASRMFRKENGMSFCEYVRRVRISQSCHMLLYTEMSVEDIAEKTGYSDTTFLSRMFKKETGLTPLQYRKRRSEAAAKSAQAPKSP